MRDIQQKGHRPEGSAGPPAGSLSEVFPATAADGGATGFVLSRIGRGAGPLLWIQDRQSRREAGRPCLAGLGGGLMVLRVDATRPVDVLWAMEEGVRCEGLSAVLGEVWGDPAALSFTATRRLAMRAEAQGVPAWLIRRAAAPGLSAARERWRVASLPSAADPDDARAPGDPRWRVELFRSRWRKPGLWEASHDRAADRVDMSAPLRDGAVAHAGAARAGGAG